MSSPFAPTAASPSDVEILTMTILAMVKKEGSYASEPYLYQQPPDIQPSPPITTSSDTYDAVTRGEDDDFIDMKCRKSMAEWSYSIVSHCGFSQETVEVAMSLLDRALSTDTEFSRAVLQDRSRSSFQLACMAALYTSIKIREAKAISPESLSVISQGIYKPSHIEDMERALLDAVLWRVVHPYTTTAFTHCLVDLLVLRRHDYESPFIGDASGLREALLELCEVQTSLAIVDYGTFGSVHPSAIAVAALRNALGSIGSNLDQCDTVLMPALVSNAAIIPNFRAYVSHIQKRLLEAIVRKDNEEASARAASPYGDNGEMDCEDNIIAEPPSPRSTLCTPFHRDSHSEDHRAYMDVSTNDTACKPVNSGHVHDFFN